MTSPSLEGEPIIQAHTNPVYVLREGKPVAADNARGKLLEKWQAQAVFYRSSELVFAREQERAELIAKVDQAMQVLRTDQVPRRRQ